jgi:hypothetical protein
MTKKTTANISIGVACIYRETYHIFSRIKLVFQFTYIYVIFVKRDIKEHRYTPTGLKHVLASPTAEITGVITIIQIPHGSFSLFLWY